jgi:hypothetical protein
MTDSKRLSVSVSRALHQRIEESARASFQKPTEFVRSVLAAHMRPKGVPERTSGDRREAAAK